MEFFMGICLLVGVILSVVGIIMFFANMYEIAAGFAYLAVFGGIGGLLIIIGVMISKNISLQGIWILLNVIFSIICIIIFNYNNKSEIENKDKIKKRIKKIKGILISTYSALFINLILLMINLWDYKIHPYKEVYDGLIDMIISSVIVSIMCTVFAGILVFKKRNYNEVDKRLNIFSKEQLSTWFLWYKHGDNMHRYVLIDEEICNIYGNKYDNLKELIIIPPEGYAELSSFTSKVNCVYFKSILTKEWQEIYREKKDTYDDTVINSSAKARCDDFTDKDKEVMIYEMLRKSSQYNRTDRKYFPSKENKINPQLGIHSVGVPLDSFPNKDYVEYGLDTHEIDGFLSKCRMSEIQTSLVNLLEDDEVYLKEKSIFTDPEKTEHYEKKFRQRFRKGIKSSAAYKDYLLKTITSKYMCCVPSDKAPGYEYNPVKRLYYSGKIGAENVYEEYAVKEFEVLGV